jgi:hypothetical protein
MSRAATPRRLFFLQGFYYLVTGIWPLLDRRTFEAVTGPKADFWLVRMVGALVTAIGGVLALGAIRRTDSPEAQALALSTALAFTAVDVNYALRGRISRVYLLDAVAEAGLMTLWSAALLRRRLLRPDTESAEQLNSAPSRTDAALAPAERRYR